MSIRILSLTGVLLIVASAFAQDRLQLRHGQIMEHYTNEDYAKVIELVDLQVQEAQSTTWQDSLHHYTYPYGRANWQVKGKEAGRLAAMEICDLVLAQNNDHHKFEALGDVSWLCYELGDLQACLRTDSAALELTIRSEQLPRSKLGKVHQWLGFDLSMLGRYQLAAEHFVQAVEVLEGQEPLDSIGLAEGCNGVGSSYWHLGRNQEAEQWYLRSLEWLGNGQSITALTRKASAVGNLALLWEDAGDLMRSKEYSNQNLRFLDQVIEKATDPKDRDEAINSRSNTYANMAALYHSVGDYDFSRKLLELSRKDREKLFGPADLKVLGLDSRLASLELSVGNAAKALELQTNYLHGCQKHLGPESEYTVDALVRLSGIVHSMGDLERADSLLTRSIDQWQSTVEGEGDPLLALAYAKRGEVRLEAQQYSKAIEDLEQALAHYLQLHGDRSRKAAKMHIMLAQAWLEGEDGRESQIEAMKHAERAIALLSPDTITSAFTWNNALPHLFSEAIFWQVRCGLATGELDHHRALEALQKAMKALDQSKVALRDEESKLLLIGAQKRIFDLAQQIAFQLAEQQSDDLIASQILALSEQRKTVLLRNRLNSFKSLSFAGVPDSIVEYEAQLLKEMQVDTEQPASVMEIADHEKAFQGLLEKLEIDYPEYFQLKYGQQQLELGQVQQLLHAGQSLVAYSFAGPDLFVVMVEQDRAEVLRLPAHGIGESALALSEAMAKQDAETYLQLGHEVFEQVMAPVMEWLQNKELLIIPDAELYYLNFETLLDAPCDLSTFKEHLLLNGYTISYLLSASTAVQFKQLDRQSQSGALALAPGFSDELKQNYRASVQDTGELDQGFLTMVQQPFAVSTAQELGRLFNAEVLLGGNASESGFKDKAGDYGIIHLGTHAEMNEVSPLYSKLVLSKEGTEDGYLHAYEVYRMQLQAELAVLTACETGAGKPQSAEGVRSLAHSFAYAGCPSLVMALWKIDEQSSSQITTKLYEGLAAGEAKNHALRNAKLDYLATADGERAMPFYWAGLVLVGDTSPIPTSQDTSPWLWLTLGVGLFLLLVLAMRLRR